MPHSPEKPEILNLQMSHMVIIGSNILRWCLTTVAGIGSGPHIVSLDSIMILLTSSVDSSLKTSSLWFEEFSGGVNNS